MAADCNGPKGHYEQVKMQPEIEFVGSMPVQEGGILVRDG